MPVPAPALKSLAVKMGVKLSRMETLWDKAKSIARDEGLVEADGDVFYAYVMGIVKRMVGSKEHASQGTNGSTESHAMVKFTHEESGSTITVDGSGNLLLQTRGGLDVALADSPVVATVDAAALADRFRSRVEEAAKGTAAKVEKKSSYTKQEIDELLDKLMDDYRRTGKNPVYALDDMDLPRAIDGLLFLGIMNGKKSAGYIKGVNALNGKDVRTIPRKSSTHTPPKGKQSLGDMMKKYAENRAKGKSPSNDKPTAKLGEQIGKIKNAIGKAQPNRRAKKEESSAELALKARSRPHESFDGDAFTVDDWMALANSVLSKLNGANGVVAADLLSEQGEMNGQALLDALTVEGVIRRDDSGKYWSC